MRTARITLLILAGLIAASPALADDGDCLLIRGEETSGDTTDDVEACRQDVWLHQGTTKVGNAAASGADAFPSWDTTAPTTPTGMGGGAAYVTNSLFHQQFEEQDPRGSFVAEGAFTGVLDNVAVDLYGQLSPIWSDDVNLRLRVDGETIFSGQVTDVRRSQVGDFEKLSFVFLNVYEMLELFEIPNEAETEHTVQIAANGVFIVNDPAIFLYDASDVPSGVVFNHEPDKLAPYTKIDTNI